MCRSTRRCAIWWNARPARRPSGPIRLLTHLRYFRLLLQPGQLLLLLRRRPITRVETIVAEITNTPWNERHAYVLQRAPERRARERRSATASTKPFMSRPSWTWTLAYDWRFNTPGETLAVHMERLQGRTPSCFDATLHLERREIGGAALAQALLAFPAHDPQGDRGDLLAGAAAWLKRVPFHTHPKKLAARSNHGAPTRRTHNEHRAHSTASSRPLLRNRIFSIAWPRRPCTQRLAGLAHGQVTLVDGAQPPALTGSATRSAR